MLLIFCDDATSEIKELGSSFLSIHWRKQHPGIFFDSKLILLSLFARCISRDSFFYANSSFSLTTAFSDRSLPKESSVHWINCIPYCKIMAWRRILIVRPNRGIFPFLYLCHGNIDLTKDFVTSDSISIPVSGETLVSIWHGKGLFKGILKCRYILPKIGKSSLRGMCLKRKGGFSSHSLSDACLFVNHDPLIFLLSADRLGFPLSHSFILAWADGEDSLPAYDYTACLKWRFFLTWSNGWQPRFSKVYKIVATHVAPESLMAVESRVVLTKLYRISSISHLRVYVRAPVSELH